MKSLSDICANCAHSCPCEDESEYVECRRYPPLIFVRAMGTVNCGFPTVEKFWSCGEFNEKEVE